MQRNGRLLKLVEALRDIPNKGLKRNYMRVTLLPRRSRGLTSLRVLDLIQMQHFHDPHSRRIKIYYL